ncbi:hypothetical protein ACSS6W_003826 [Trichoderma asperelloides]
MQASSTQLVWPPLVSTVRTRKRSAETFATGAPPPALRANKTSSAGLRKKSRREPRFHAGGPDPRMADDRRQAIWKSHSSPAWQAAVLRSSAVLRNTALQPLPIIPWCFALARSICVVASACTPYPAARWVPRRLRRTQVPSTSMSSMSTPERH